MKETRNRKIISWFMLMFSIANLISRLLVVEYTKDVSYYVGFISSNMLVILSILSLIYAYYRQDKN